MLATLAVICFSTIIFAASKPVSAASIETNSPSPVIIAAAKIDPSKLLVRPKQAAPSLWSDPMGWINVKQREFTGAMQKTLHGMRGEARWSAAWTLMLLSFGYGVFHAAGPGHGKTVISAWLLANEHQLRRGVQVAFMAAIVQALTAIILVSILLVAVKSVGSSARNIAGSLEAASYALITALGLYLIWQAMRPVLIAAPAGHGHHQHIHDHNHGSDCDCGHAHMPSASDLTGTWSLKRAFAIAFAVGIRPCSGAILALLASSAIGIYWAGIASTIFMAIGTAITVSAIACIAVTSRSLAMKLAGGNSLWLDRTAFALKFFGGLFIAFAGGLLFWATVTGSSSLI